MSMYSFRIHIHRRPPEVGEDGDVQIHGCTVPALGVLPTTMATSLHVSFDRATEILSTLPRMFIEPDGAFVWTGEHGGTAWQVEGVLCDAGSRLAHVELSGRCPPDEFDQFLAALGWPALPLMFQWSPAGVFVGEAEFRRIATRNGI